MKPSKRARKRPLKLKDEDNSRNCGPINDNSAMMPFKRARKRPLKDKDGSRNPGLIYDSSTMIPSRPVKKRSPKLKDEGSDIWYELTVMEDLLQRLSLTRVILEDYVVFMRSEFDPHSNIGLALGVSGTNILSPQAELFLATYPRYDQIGPIRLFHLFSPKSWTNQIVCFYQVQNIMGDTSLLTMRLVSLCLVWRL